MYQYIVLGALIGTQFEFRTLLLGVFLGALFANTTVPGVDKGFRDVLYDIGTICGTLCLRRYHMLLDRVSDKPTVVHGSPITPLLREL
jgi:hypothetical protein